MSIRRMIQAGLFGLCVVSFSVLPVTEVVADDVDDEEEEAPPPAKRPPPPPPPPAPRPAPPPQWEPPPQREMPPRYEPAPQAVVEPVSEEVLSGFWLAPEVLYWKFTDSDVSFASGGGEVFRVDDDYELGGRLGLGYRWASGLDFIVRGTSVENDQDASVRGALVTRHGTATRADAFVDVDYLTLDGEVGYTWGAPDRSRFRLFGGPRFASIEQTFAESSFEPLPKGNTVQEIDFEGFGLRVGGEGHLGLGESGWSIFLNGAVAGVDGDFDTFFDGDGDGVADPGDSLRSFTDTVFEWEAQAGFAWNHQYGPGSLFGVRFGYEVVEWTDIPTFRDAAVVGDFDTSDEDFSAEGAFFGVQWIF